MDCKGNCEIKMASEPSAYKFIPRVPKDRKQMILIAVILVLLVTIIIGAILIGVHITQEHTEKIIKTIINEANGELMEQTVMLNNQESVAVFQIQSNRTAATVVYDYQHHLIAFRIHKRRQCSVVSMDLVDVPSLNEVTQLIKLFDKQALGDDNLAYTFTQGKMADQTTLGTTINVLCSDIPIYWAEENHKETRSGSLPCLGILVIKLCFDLL